jgi:hypothetical protein
MAVETIVRGIEILLSVAADRVTDLAEAEGALS